ncbi:MAG: Unknown protein [uncultured Sulfurovum sp.]|uniref:CzcB-like barrel-sandwich hybrid domain-containing protein n=1 Tax=uncultured Sulfurovum sp. TaxID=269237 RepID=A0A6S6S1R6_9BACT|nr:MAG: Unknown protein [uncultured Sulfurovum sp.]
MKHPITYLLTILFFSLSPTYGEENYILKEEVHNLYFENHGRVEAIQRANLSAETAGVIEYLGVNISETFKKGDVLLKISSVLQNAKVKEVKHTVVSNQLDLNEKRRRYLRIKKLRKQNLATKEDLTQRETAYTRAKQTLAHSKEQLVQMNEVFSYTKVSAPFDGVVEQRHIRLSEKVSTGQELFSIYNKNKMRVVVTVPESILKKIKKHQKVLVEVEGKTYEIDFENIVIFPTSYNYSYTLRLIIPMKLSSSFHDGNFVSVKFKIGEEKALYLDSKYIHRKHELTMAYLKKDEQIITQYIRLGKKENRKRQILSGLVSGDCVVINAE